MSSGHVGWVPSRGLIRPLITKRDDGTRGADHGPRLLVRPQAPAAGHLRIIFVDVPPDQPEQACYGLARFHALFGRYYPLDWWKGTKVRVRKFGFVVRIHTWDGRIAEDEFKLTASGKLMTRTVR